VALVKNESSEESIASIIRAIVFLCSVHRLLVAANAVHSSPILVILMMNCIRSSDTSVLTRVTRRNVPQDGILTSMEVIIIQDIRKLLKLWTRHASNYQILLVTDKKQYYI
jgi:hypothetical protein